MITNYFKCEKNKTVVHEFFELHSSFIPPHAFKNIHCEVKEHFCKNSTRLSCVCTSQEHLVNNFLSYDLPHVIWTPQILDIKNKICETYDNPIDYGLVHYYHDETSVINWHSDREALRSYIYSISVGGVRTFCLQNKTTMKIHSFNLYDGDLFIMKPGCQDRYKHCIKSVKHFNAPRISITFRQIENPMCYYVYNVATLSVNMENYGDVDNVEDAVEIITKLRQNIYICLKSINDTNSTNDTDDNEEYFINTGTSKNFKSLLKSNLQKAVRRNKKKVAIQTALTMINNNMIVDLLRRLTIISIEDVQINKYYPVIVWYYVVLSSATIFKLKKKDVVFICSYVGLLCDIPILQSPNFQKNNKIMTLQDICEINGNNNNNCNKIQTICLALYIRIQYGGFDGEIHLLNNVMCDILQNNNIIINDDIVLLKNMNCLMTKNIDILPCAIDFHCYPQMLEKVLATIDKKHALTEHDIKQYIWNYDSNVNYRTQITKNPNNIDALTWKNVIKPKCMLYRKLVQKNKSLFP